jgi:hypothetical protein
VHAALVYRGGREWKLRVRSRSSANTAALTRTARRLDCPRVILTDRQRPAADDLGPVRGGALSVTPMNRTVGIFGDERTADLVALALALVHRTILT